MSINFRFMVHKDSPLLVYYALRKAAKLGYGTVKMTGVKNECDQSKTETKARNEVDREEWQQKQIASRWQ